MTMIPLRNSQKISPSRAVSGTHAFFLFLMKLRLSLLSKCTSLILAATSLLQAAAPLKAADATGLQAGAAAVDITPDQWPLSLRGSFTPRSSEGVNDPLHARAIALKNGEGKVVIVIVDNIGIGRETLDEVKKRAAEATGWKPEEMLIAATHTHTAPSISSTSTLGAQAAYREKSQGGIVKSIVDAIAKLQPAEIAFGSDNVPDEVKNRRSYLKEGTMPVNPFGEYDKVKTNAGRADIVKPAGPTDPEVAVLDVRTRKGRALAFLANYSLHYVGGMKAGTVSADYFGEYARLMAYRVGGSNPPPDFVAMMSNGTSGDINNIDFDQTRPPREPFEQIRLVAAKCADASWRATRTAERHENPRIAIVQREVELSRRRPTPEMIERAKKIVAMTKEERAQLPGKTENYAHRTLSAVEAPEKMPVLLQAMCIGDQAIVTMPFEVFVEIGLEIKKKSPFPRTFMIELANGAGGYLPTPAQHELGGYETWLGTNNVQKDASDILTKHLLEMLAELKAGAK
jgi:hypothetical protein